MKRRTILKGIFGAPLAPLVPKVENIIEVESDASISTLDCMRKGYDVLHRNRLDKLANPPVIITSGYEPPFTMSMHVTNTPEGVRRHTMTEYAHAKTDSDGDTFVKKYGVYTNDEAAVNDTLVQLEKNYESAFGETPEADDMRHVLTFIDLFFSEIGETCATTVYAEAGDRLSWAIEDCPVKTAENIRSMRPDSYRPVQEKTTADLYAEWKSRTLGELDHFTDCSWHGYGVPINVCDCESRHAFEAGKKALDIK